MRRELSPEEEERNLFDSYVGKLVSDPDVEINEKTLEKVRTAGVDIGLSAEEAEARFIDKYKETNDPEYRVTRKGFDIHFAFSRFKCPKQREALAHYIKYAIASKYIKQILDLNYSRLYYAGDEGVEKFLQQVETTVSLHYSNDDEIKALFEQLKGEYTKIKEEERRKIRRGFAIAGKIIGYILLTVLILFILLLCGC